MKRMKYMVAAVAACIAVSTASAGIVFQDTFDYTAGNAMIAEGGWTAWGGSGGSDAGSGIFWGNSVAAPGAWLEYNDTTPVVADKVIITEGNVSRTGGYGYTMSIDLWDGSDTNSRVTVAGGVQELSPGAALTPVSYRTVAGDAGKYIIFKYEHATNWGETTDVTLSVSDPGAPEWSTNSIQGAEAIENLPYFDTLAGLATDPNGDEVTYSLVGTSPWLSVASNGDLTGTPGTGDIGSHTFTVAATDSIDGSSNATLNITVAAFTFNPAESASISINFAENNNQSFAGGQLIGPLSSDSANWNNSIDRTTGTAAAGTLAGMIDDRGTNSGATISWNSSGVWYNSDGIADDQHKVAVGYLDDGETTPSTGVSIAIDNIPYTNYKVYGLFSSGQSTEVMAGRDFAVNGAWVYGTGGAASSTPVYGNINANNATNGAYWTETIPGVSTGNYWTAEATTASLTVTAQVQDGTTRGSLAGLVIQNLDALPQPPVWNEIPVEESAITGREISGTLAGKAGDPNGDTLTFSRTSSGLPWLSVATNGDLSGTPGTTGTNTFLVVVTDGNTTPVTNTLNVTVTAGMAPTWTTDPMQGADGIDGSAYTESLAGLATDLNGDALTYSLVSTPTWLSVAANGDLTGTPGTGDIGPNTFTVSVTDNIDGSDTAELNIEIFAAPSSVLIDNTTRNGSFEDETGKININEGGVSFWETWTEVATAFDDTGADAASAGTQNGLDGARIAYLQGGGAIINMDTNAPHTIQAGDVIVYSFWNSLVGRGDAAISLVYDDAGTRTEIPGTSITAIAGAQGVGQFTVQAGDAWIGKALGVGIAAVGSWPEVDQIYLALTPGTAGPVTDLGIGVVSGGAAIALSWTSEASASYMVQTNGNLIISDGWQDSGVSIPGTGGPLSITNTIGSDPALFYRVITE